ncbi:MAG: diaminopimelate epimerase [Bacteroidales bacterium]|nr:diaminopimelate epimerase [Bacteroidales bacterium]MDD3665385.1 diaminopimelate epimerase [Bacteroidales bacterium]
MIVPFSKYHGTGNDFILIDGRLGLPLLTQGVVASLCERRTGIGSDGLIVLQPSVQADFRMLYYNADGLTATMCGNGGRCVTAFASQLGLIGSETVFEASDGLHEAHISKAGSNHSFVSLSMVNVDLITPCEEGDFLNTGVPHLVVFTNELTALDVQEQGRRLRNLTKFQPAGTNVNFAQVLDNCIMVRTYERGVEDETLSCGTGITATVLAHARRNHIKKGETAVMCRGGNLSVSFQSEGNRFTQIRLQGPAVHVFDGNLTL